jgi:hypothetical protein
MLLLAAVLAGGACACDQKKPETNTTTDPVAEPSARPREPEPERAPELAVDEAGPRVGWDHVRVDDDRAMLRLRAALEPHRKWFEGQKVEMKALAKVDPRWVVWTVTALGELGASSVEIETATRPGYPPKIAFTPQSRLGAPPPECSLVAQVLEDRGTAVWKVSGGTATKKRRGLGGPDLTTTAEVIERFAKACETSDTMFVGHHEAVPWGQLYDLAASAQIIPNIRWNRVVLLAESPVAGRPIL